MSDAVETKQEQPQEVEASAVDAVVSHEQAKVIYAALNACSTLEIVAKTKSKDSTLKAAIDKAKKARLKADKVMHAAGIGYYDIYPSDG